MGIKNGTDINTSIEKALDNAEENMEAEMQKEETSDIHLDDIIIKSR